MQGRNRANSQSAMIEGDDAADRCPPEEGASTICLGLPKVGNLTKSRLGFQLARFALTDRLTRTINKNDIKD